MEEERRERAEGVSGKSAVPDGTSAKHEVPDKDCGMPEAPDDTSAKPEVPDGVWGAITGDIVGSVYEFHNVKTTDFPFWSDGCRFTDDTVMTIAVYSALREYIGGGRRGDLHSMLVKQMKTVGRRYPDCGYGRRFIKWIEDEDDGPYNSYGNGSAMRVSAAGALAESLCEAGKLGKISAQVTHDHPEGIKGAVAVAEAVFMAGDGCSKTEIRRTMEEFYSLDFTLDEIRPNYSFDVSCQGSVPQALEAFMESSGFQDCIRLAVSIGGDSDTIAAMAGSVAGAYYGVPADIKEKAMSYLDCYLRVLLTGERS